MSPANLYVESLPPLPSNDARRQGLWEVMGLVGSRGWGPHEWHQNPWRSLRELATGLPSLQRLVAGGVVGGHTRRSQQSTPRGRERSPEPLAIMAPRSPTSVSIPLRNKFLLLISPPVCGALFRQPAQRRPLPSSSSVKAEFSANALANTVDLSGPSWGRS